MAVGREALGGAEQRLEMGADLVRAASGQERDGRRSGLPRGQEVAIGCGMPDVLGCGTRAGPGLFLEWQQQSQRVTSRSDRFGSCGPPGPYLWRRVPEHARPASFE